MAPSSTPTLSGAWHLAGPPTPNRRVFGHTQNNGAALGVGHTTTCRFEFGVDVLGAGLEGGEKVKLAHGVCWLID